MTIFDLTGLWKRLTSPVKIGRRIVFFNRVFYVPYTGVLTIRETAGGWQLIHPAFKGGNFYVSFLETTKSLMGFGFKFMSIPVRVVYNSSMEAFESFQASIWNNKGVWEPGASIMDSVTKLAVTAKSMGYPEDPRLYVVLQG